MEAYLSSGSLVSKQSIVSGSDVFVCKIECILRYICTRSLSFGSGIVAILVLGQTLLAIWYSENSKALLGIQLGRVVSRRKTFGSCENTKSSRSCESDVSS